MNKIAWKMPVLSTGLGVTTNSFEQSLRTGEISLEKLLEYAAQTGFSWVELRDQLVDLSADDCRKIKETADVLGLQIHYAWNNRDVTEPCDNLEKALENAATFGENTHCRVVIAPDLLKGKKGYDERDVRAVWCGLNRYIDRAKGYGVTLCFENTMEPIEQIGGFCGMEDLFRKCLEMRSTFDAANMVTQVIGSEIDTVALKRYYRDNQSQLPYFHLKTACGGKPSSKIQENGDFKLGELLQEFSSGTLVCLELPPQASYRAVKNNIEQSLKELEKEGYIRCMI